tara:strand:+ start:259 stop:660 length:402 start_codon:yes stop_codon:yes gene_type:complete
MAISGTKADEAAFGQYGNTYLTGNGAKMDLKSSGKSPKFICAITFLDATTFQTLTNYNSTRLDNACISTVDGEDEIDAEWQCATANASNFATVITTSHEFPKGVTIYGAWSSVELNGGSCICYFAPTGKTVEV